MLISLAPTLADLYPSTQDLRRVLDACAIDPTRIVITGHAVNDWHNATREAEHQDLLHRLLLFAINEYPNHRGLRTLYQLALSTYGQTNEARSHPHAGTRQEA
jgi:hypothetical protein